MATSQQAVIFSLLVVLLLSSLQLAHGRGPGAARRQHYHVVQTRHLEPKSFCSGHKVVPSAGGTWVPLHRPFGPCSPSSRGPARPPPSLIEMLRWDQVRTEYVRRKATGMADDVLNPAKPRVTVMQLDYSPTAAFGVGSGYGGSAAAIDADGDGDSMILSQTMSIDTTVDVPWIQCAPCPVPQCYAQKNALFDPSRSSTSAAVRCGSPACRSLGSYGNGCSSNSTRNGGDCQYLIEYSGDRATAGTYMTDTLTISSSTTVINFRFGCSHSVRGKFSDQTAGTMSLGGGAQSLLSQTARGLGNAFSYCVPAPSSSGFLSLGGPATTRTTTNSSSSSRSRFASTPLLRNAVNPSLYLVWLQGIVVAGRRLRVPPAVFSPGAIMDSSAVVTGAAAYGVPRAAPSLREGHGGVPDDRADGEPGHLLRLPRVHQRDGARSLPCVWRRRRGGAGAAGRDAEWMPGLHCHLHRLGAGLHRQRADADARGALRCRRRERGLPPWRMLARLSKIIN